ncbi:MAG: hypothetical protein JW787_16125 [Sedimentisphaerales bacterium]|nr:hypothetical protein [Sedimentisphaerales bacterium]
MKYLVISVNHLSSSLIINGVTINRYGQNKQIPCYLFKAEIDHTTESGLYRVYLRPSEFLEVEEPSEDWNPLVWETTDEKEAAEIVEELCQCGVGETNPEKQCQVIPGNKKIGIAVLTCWILCLLAIIFYLMHSIQSEISNPNSIESPLLLVKTVVIFGLLSFIVYACYKIWFGYLAIKHRQIPPPNTIVFLDTIFFKGEKAVKHGRKIVAFGFIAIVVGLLIAIYADYKLKEMIPNQNNQQTLTTNQNQ